MTGERTLLLVVVVTALLLLGAVGWVLVSGGPTRRALRSPLPVPAVHPEPPPPPDVGRRTPAGEPAQDTVHGAEATGKTRARARVKYLQGSEWVEGVVRDATTGKPVEEFYVTALLVERGKRHRKVLFHTRKPFHSPDGRFLLDNLPAGTFQLTATAEGYVDDTHSDVPIGLGGPRIAIDFALKSPWTLTGTVRDSSGLPLPGLQVFLVGPEPDTPRKVQRPHHVRDGRRTIGRGETSSNGTFRLSSIAEGDFSLLVGPRAAPLISMDPTSFRIGNRYVQDITVPAQAEIEIDVQTADYRPIRGARVTLWSLGLGNPVNGSTNAEGRFHRDRMVPGTYRLLVSKNAYQRFSERVELQSGEILRRSIVLQPFENPFR